MADILEDVIRKSLTGEAQARALDFAAHLRAHGIQLDTGDSYWEVKFDDADICHLWVDGSENMPGPWTIWSCGELGAWGRGDCPVDERTRDIVWAHVNFCANCGGGCNPGTTKTVLGKVFDEVCSSTLAYTNPDANALARAKEMVNVRIKDLTEVS